MPAELRVKHDQYIQNYLVTGVKKMIDSGNMVPLVHRSGTVLQVFLNVTEVCHINTQFFVGTFLSKVGYEELQNNLLVRCLDTSLAQLVNPVIMVTNGGVVKIFNEAAQNDLGWKSEEVIGKNVTILMPERYAQVLLGTAGNRKRGLVLVVEKGGCSSSFHSLFYLQHHQAFIRRYLQTGTSKVINKTRILPFLTSKGEEKNYYMSITEKRMADTPIYWIAILTPEISPNSTNGPQESLEKKNGEGSV
eukprot:TRINITY_DN8793_c0_g1_i1.p1 TRINITY_DN8793_c0_g1~~TRINITY_DN8793_c0_g1_i1.p1  ORF type:complete len:248 (-),score=54.59 TRINITY_DN8793_c0_g1_i1:129-872(-)